MNNFLNDPKIVACLAMLVFSVVIYFYINYQVTTTVRLELARVKKHEKMKLAKQAQLARRQQYVQSKMGRSDQDSYYDPAEDGGMRDDRDVEYEEDNEDMHQGGEKRLTKDNILMRDMIGL